MLTITDTSSKDIPVSHSYSPSALIKNITLILLSFEYLLLCLHDYRVRKGYITWTSDSRMKSSLMKSLKTTSWSPSSLLLLYSCFPLSPFCGDGSPWIPYTDLTNLSGLLANLSSLIVTLIRKSVGQSPDETGRLTGLTASWNELSLRRVDPSALALSLSLHRHSFISILYNFRFISS